MRTFIVSFVIGAVSSLPNLALAKQDAQVACSVRAILERERAAMPATSNIVRIPSGGAMLNPFAFVQREDSAASVHGTATQRRAGYLESVVEIPRSEGQAVVSEVRALMVSSVQESALDEATRTLLVNRISRLRVEFEDCSFSEGRNSASQFKVSLCRNSLKMPRLGLVSLIAHEIGHSVDLCNLGSRLISRSNPSTPLNISRFPENSTGFRRDFNRNMSEFSQPGTSYGLDRAFVLDNETSERFATALRVNRLTIADAGVPLDRNPARAAYLCLVNGGRYQALPPTQTEACSNDSVRESGAQIWAARATARYIDLHPPRTSLDAVSLFANSVGEGFWKGENPKEKDMNRIYLSEPSIQRALNCRPEPQQSCSNHFLRSGSAPSSAPTGSSRSAN